MKRINQDVAEVQRWFNQAVTYEGEPYCIDYEQAAAVADDSFNTIVVARAGSGKTRTIVAKIIYLVAKCGVKPEEILVFVFNANAAREINERLMKMRVDGEAVITEGVANTFHAFALKIVHRACRDERQCGKILAEEKNHYVVSILEEMMYAEDWREKIWRFVKNDWGEEVMGMQVSEEELMGLAGMMTTFINRAQQKYLGGKRSLGEVAREYLAQNEVSEREEVFIELGVECFRRYHWYLLDDERKLDDFSDYGTDFNLIVSWASKIIGSGREEVNCLLVGKKYILIDEYQDFSQLFLATVEAIRKVAVSAHLFVVGDDWQAINRFAGSEVEYFKGFERYFGGEDRDGDFGAGLDVDGLRGKVARYEITTNYRCDRAVVATARRFMKKAMRENGDFRAFSCKNGKVVVINPREAEVGYALVPYDLRVSVCDRILREATERMGAKVVKKSMVRYLKTVVEIIRANLKMEKILILHRNNETNIGGVSLVGFGRGLRWGLDRLGIMGSDEFLAKVQLMTMHKSKGLEADVVIILEADDGVIPKVHPDTILYRMFGETEKVALADQKRLFYVAMTRAKHRLYILSEGGGFIKHLGKGVEKW